MAMAWIRQRVLTACAVLAACGGDDVVPSDGDQTTSTSTGSAQVPDTTGSTTASTPDPVTTGDSDSTTDAPDPTTGGSDGPELPSPKIPTSTFVEVTEAAGLSFDPGRLQNAPHCIIDHVASPQGGDYCVPERFLGAVAVGDYDGDGWPDVYFTAIGRAGILMRNLGDGTFADATMAAGLDAAPRAGGIAWADIEGDGDLDLMLTNFGGLAHRLYVNDGHGHFADEAARRGVEFRSSRQHTGTGIAVGDYDRDGYVDLFIAQWRSSLIMGPSADYNRLLRNRGAEAPGYFEDVTAAQGFDFQAVAAEAGAVPGAYGFAPAFVDLDGDGWPELAVTGDYGTSRLFWNDEGTFVDGTDDSGVGTDKHGMGSAFGDYDGDGDLDWFVTAIELYDGTGGNRMYRNDGARAFTDVTDPLGVRNGGWGWGTSFFDAELDGDLDLTMAAGWPNQHFGEDPVRLWRNDGPDGPWPETTAAQNLLYTDGGRGLVTFDYDRDGDLDVLVHGNTESPALFRNDTDGGRWLVVDPVGEAANAEALNTVVRVQVDEDGPWQVRHVGVGSQLFGQGESEAHFGLGAEALRVHQVEVTWPSGATATRTQVPVDQRLTIAP